MFTNIDIVNFKDVEEEHLQLKPITLLMGHNSAGKSTCLQAILCTLYHCALNARVLLSRYDFSFETLANKYTNAKSFNLKLTTPNGYVEYVDSVEGERNINQSGDDSIDLEKNVYYLSANRLGFKEFEDMSSDYHVGVQGEYLFGDFQQNKSTVVTEGLRVVPESDTLAAHLNYWLSYILDCEYVMDTEEINKKSVQVKYIADRLPRITPDQLGVGVSYLTKVLLMCLRAASGDTLMIENPEIHLHPAACARLGEFFVYVAKAGIQLIVETHNEHIVKMLQYSVYRGKVDSNDAVIYYKSNPTDCFLRIDMNHNGVLSEDIPQGFFDATLSQLIEMQ